MNKNRINYHVPYTHLTHKIIKLFYAFLLYFHTLIDKINISKQKENVFLI